MHKWQSDEIIFCGYTYFYGFEDLKIKNYNEASKVLDISVASLRAKEKNFEFLATGIHGLSGYSKQTKAVFVFLVELRNNSKSEATFQKILSDYINNIISV